MSEVGIIMAEEEKAEEKKPEKKKKPKRYEKRKDGFYYCLICGMYRNLDRNKIRAHVKGH